MPNVCYTSLLAMEMPVDLVSPMNLSRLPYRVLLVDDELLDLSLLKEVVQWERLGLLVTREASRASQALAMIEDGAVDIVISDIRMPIMSGLELCERAKARFPALRFIFITGHEDFQYARMAIRMHADGYVLKPIEISELERVLKDLVADLDRSTSTAGLAVSLAKTLPFAEREFLRALFKGPLRIGQLHEFSEHSGRTWSADALFCAAILEIDDLGHRLNRLPREERGAAGADIHDRILDTLNGMGVDLAASITDERIGLALESDKKRAAETLQGAIDALGMAIGGSVTIGLGSEVIGIESMYRSYLDALASIGYKIIVGKRRVITKEEIEERAVIDKRELDSILNGIFTALLAYDESGLRLSFRNLFDMLKQVAKKGTVANVLMYLSFRLRDFLMDRREDPDEVLIGENDFLAKALELETLNEMRDWLTERFITLSMGLRRLGIGLESRLIRDVKGYVRKNLSTQVSLRDAANNYGYSPNHLGYLFKKETGVGFSEFLIRERMEKARELLGDSTLRVYEIADRVGYRDMAYFNRQFKLLFGMTPGEYKKQ